MYDCKVGRLALCCKMAFVKLLYDKGFLAWCQRTMGGFAQKKVYNASKYESSCLLIWNATTLKFSLKQTWDIFLAVQKWHKLWLIKLARPPHPSLQSFFGEALYQVKLKTQEKRCKEERSFIAEFQNRSSSTCFWFSTVDCSIIFMCKSWCSQTNIGHRRKIGKCVQPWVLLKSVVSKNLFYSPPMVENIIHGLMGKDIGQYCMRQPCVWPSHKLYHASHY